MKQQLKKIYHKSKYYLPPVIFDKLAYIRAYKHFLQYKDLVAKNIELKDKHKGERCFILGSGPSIKKEDLRPLKNEIVFALNNFYVHPDFDTIMSGKKSKYYMTAPIHPPQTEKEWKEWFENMQKHMPKHVNMIFGLDGYKKNIKYILDKYKLFKDYKINWYFAGINVNEYYKFNKKDINITNMIWSANTVSIYALIVTIYMGFDEIYLVGMDHNYMCIQKKEDYRFYKNAIHQKDEEKKALGNKSYNYHELKSLTKIFSQYQILKNSKKVQIYNCSNKSLLDIFEYKSLKEIEK